MTCDGVVGCVRGTRTYHTPEPKNGRLKKSISKNNIEIPSQLDLVIPLQISRGLGVYVTLRKLTYKKLIYRYPYFGFRFIILTFGKEGVLLKRIHTVKIIFIVGLSGMLPLAVTISFGMYGRSHFLKRCPGFLTN